MNSAQKKLCKKNVQTPEQDGRATAATAEPTATVRATATTAEPATTVTTTATVTATATGRYSTGTKNERWKKSPGRIAEI